MIFLPFLCVDYVTIPLNQGNDRTRAEEQRETLLTLHQLIPENGNIQNDQSSTTENPALRRYTHFHSEDAVSVSESDVTTPATPQQVNFTWSHIKWVKTLIFQRKKPPKKNPGLHYGLLYFYSNTKIDITNIIQIMSDQNGKEMLQIITIIILRIILRMNRLVLRIIRMMMKSLEIPCLYHTMWLFPKKLLMMVCHFSVLIVKTCQLIIWIHKITR